MTYDHKAKLQSLIDAGKEIIATAPDVPGTRRRADLAQRTKWETSCRLFLTGFRPFEDDFMKATEWPYLDAVKAGVAVLESFMENIEDSTYDEVIDRFRPSPDVPPPHRIGFSS